MTFVAMIVVAAMLAVIGLMTVARRAGISKRAWLLLQIVPFAAPDLATPEALDRAIAKDRAQGPAKPSRRLLKRFDFKDEREGDDRIFRVIPKGGATTRLYLFYLHGGGYVLDLQAVQWGLVAALIARTGAEMVIPIYPLAPEQSWEAGFDSVQRCYLALLRECPAEQIVIVADSAGGGLALGLVQRLKNIAPLPAAIVMFSPWLDVGASGPDQPEIERRDPALSIDFLRRAGSMWACGLPADDPRISPVFGDQQGLPPIQVFTGTRDILDSDARRLAAVNPKVVLRSYRNMFHVWPAGEIIPEAVRALDEAAVFIGEHVKR